SDDPAKGLGMAESDGLLIHQLHEILGDPESHVELVSPYFVPTAAGTEAFARMAERGVKIRVLTNSLDATDVAAVHAGYAKRRKDLLEAGILLYEMRRLSPEKDHKENLGPFGSSGSSLHEHLRRGSFEGVRGLVQLRSTPGRSQYGTGLRDRKSKHGGRDRRGLRHQHSRELL